MGRVEHTFLFCKYADEVWEGIYVMPSMPNNVHQLLVDDLGDIFREAVKKAGLGQGYPGANVLVSQDGSRLFLSTTVEDPPSVIDFETIAYST